MGHFGLINQRMNSEIQCQDFGECARILMASHGRMSDARDMAGGASPRVREIFEKALPGNLGTAFGSPGWGGELADFEQVAAGFVESLSNTGTFDTVAAQAVQVPLRTILSVVVMNAAGEAGAEGALKSIGEFQFANVRLEARKCIAQVIMSSELIRLGGPGANNLILNSLRTGVTAATDAEFCSLMVAATTPIPSVGNVFDDLSALVSALQTGSQSSVFIIVSPATARRLAVKDTTDGAFAFPQMGVAGGQLGNLQALVSDGVADGVIIAVDAASLAVSTGTVTLGTAEHASIDMDGASPVNATFNLWQRDCIGIRAERWWGAEPLRDGAVASLSGASWGAASP